MQVLQSKINIIIEIILKLNSKMKLIKRYKNEKIKKKKKNEEVEQQSKINKTVIANYISLLNKIEKKYRKRKKRV